MCSFCSYLETDFLYFTNKFSKLSNLDKKIALSVGLFFERVKVSRIPQYNSSSLNFLLDRVDSKPCKKSLSHFNFLDSFPDDYESEEFMSAITFLADDLDSYIVFDKNSSILNNTEKDKKNITSTPYQLSLDTKAFVKGQDEVVDNLSLIIYQQILKSKGLFSSPQKINSLIIGESGTGKTHIIKTLSKLSGLPHVCIPATSITQEGWAGGNISEYLSELYSQKNGKYGIVFIDEFDKISTTFRDHQIQSHHENLQSELLTLIEGQVYNSKDGLKDLHYDSKNMIFIFSGSFDEGIKDMSRNGIGYSANIQKERNRDEIYQTLTKKQLLKFGLKRELLGRIQNFTRLNKLSKDVLKDILFAKNGFLSYYENYFKSLNIKLTFDDAFIDDIVENHSDTFGVRSLNDDLFSKLNSLMTLAANIKNQKFLHLHMTIETVTDIASFKEMSDNEILEYISHVDNVVNIQKEDDFDDLEFLEEELTFNDDIPGVSNNNFEEEELENRPLKSLNMFKNDIEEPEQLSFDFNV